MPQIKEEYTEKHLLFPFALVGFSWNSKLHTLLLMNFFCLLYLCYDYLLYLCFVMLKTVSFTK